MSALIVETIEQRVERLLPRATSFESRTAPPAERWKIMRDGKTLGVGSTFREAADRALFLFGAQR